MGKLSKQGTRWTDEDVAFLKEAYPDYRMIKLQKVLERSSSAIRSKADKLGLERNRED